MKIVSVLFFGAALVATWVVSYAERPVAQSMHLGIQSDLKQIIRDYVEQNSNATTDGKGRRNLRFKKFWTESIKKDRVKAYFVYSFEDLTSADTPAEIEISGSAILNKVDENPDVVTWSLDELQVTDNTVQFSEPLKIKPDQGNNKVDSDEDESFIYDNVDEPHQKDHESH